MNMCRKGMFVCISGTVHFFILHLCTGMTQRKTEAHYVLQYKLKCTKEIKKLHIEQNGRVSIGRSPRKRLRDS